MGQAPGVRVCSLAGRLGEPQESVEPPPVSWVWFPEDFDLCVGEESLNG